MKKGFNNLLVFLIVLMSGCAQSSRDELSPREYVHLVTDAKSELRRTVQSGIWTYDFQYKPSLFIALKEQDPGHFNRQIVNKRVHDLEGTIWFNVDISSSNKTDDPLKYATKNLEEYNARLEYFLIHAAKNFQLYYGGSLMPQIGYYFENNYNIKPVATAIVGYRIPDAAPSKDIKLEYYDGLLNAGILKALFEQKAINNLPPVAISQSN